MLLCLGPSSGHDLLKLMGMRWQCNTDLIVAVTTGTVTNMLCVLYPFEILYCLSEASM